MKRSRLHARGRRGSAFPKERDPGYWAWLFRRLARWERCDGCEKNQAIHRAHLIPRSRGGPDRDNIVLLCYDCHEHQEKRTEAFEMEMYGFPKLQQRAKWWTKQYDERERLPF